MRYERIVSLTNDTAILVVDNESNKAARRQQASIYKIKNWTIKWRIKQTSSLFENFCNTVELWSKKMKQKL